MSDELKYAHTRLSTFDKHGWAYHEHYDPELLHADIHLVLVALDQAQAELATLRAARRGIEDRTVAAVRAELFGEDGKP